jgi:hypothetical protein
MGMNRAPKRVAFIDQARALAITMMLVGHSLHRFLGEPWRSGELYRHYAFVRGLSSALFLTIAGFSFVVASMGHLEEYQRLSPRLYRRLRRIGVILLLGLVIQLPTSTVYGFLLSPTHDGWERIFAFNVLQNIGFGLLLMHGVLFFSKSIDRFRWWMGLSAIAILLLATLTYRPSVDAALPAWLKGALNLSHRARFPAVPFTAFICLGAVLGAVFWKLRGSVREQWVFVGAASIALFFIAFELLIRHGVPGGLFPYSTPAPKMPGNTFARAGCALLIISALYFIARRHLFLPRLSRLMSQCSLAIYFTHLYLVYGGASAGGLFSGYRYNLHPGLVALWIAGLLGTMVGMAAVLTYADRHHRERYRQLQRVALATLLIQLCCFPRMTLLGVLVTFAVVGAISEARRLSPNLPAWVRPLLRGRQTKPGQVQ